MTQLGIVSWGSSSCSSHTVFTRVKSFNTVINNTVGVPLRRNVRMTWSANLSQCHIRLSYDRPYLHPTSASNTFTVPATGTVDYACAVTD